MPIPEGWGLRVMGSGNWILGVIITLIACLESAPGLRGLFNSEE